MNIDMEKALELFPDMMEAVEGMFGDDLEEFLAEIYNSSTSKDLKDKLNELVYYDNSNVITIDEEFMSMFKVLIITGMCIGSAYTKELIIDNTKKMFEGITKKASD